MVGGVPEPEDPGHQPGALAPPGEQIYVVSPLALPDASTPDPSEAEAVRLFLDRARAIEPGLHLTQHDLDAVAEICRRLDGLPLAIELAAARVRLLPPQAMLARLIGSSEQAPAHDIAERHAPLRLLVDGPRDLPARQRDLRHTIAWSHDLLTDTDAAGFRHLAVFVGGWTLDAAEAVVGDGSWVMGHGSWGGTTRHPRPPKPDTCHPTPSG